jgi:hypothetical protein
MNQQKNNNFLHVGAELILTVMLIPFAVWLITSIFALQANSGQDAIKIDQIKLMLEKQDQKLDNITSILINKEK